MCTAGHYCLEGSEVAAPTDGTQGDECPAGTYCPEGSTIPIECPLGTYSNTAGQDEESDCATCDAGQKCLTRGLTAPSSDCPAGYYCTQDPFTLIECPAGSYCAAGVDDHTQCISGEYQQYTLQSSCDTCPTSYYCAQTDTSTKNICPAGAYCESGVEAATDCLAGTYNPRDGALEQADCEDCPYGKYCGTAGLSTSGSDCDAGYYCTRGADSAQQAACSAGHYCPSGTIYEIPCPAGTFNADTGSALLSDCDECPVGQY